MMNATTRPTTNRSRPEVWKHGANCYVNHGCRCATCTKGAREYRARYARRPRLGSAPGRVVQPGDPMWEDGFSTGINSEILDDDDDDEDLEDDDDDLDDEDDNNDDEIDD